MAVNADETRLAVGCEDGFVRLFDVSEGSFEYSRSLPGSDGVCVRAHRWLCMLMCL